MTLPTRPDYPVIAVGDLHGRRDWLEMLVTRLRELPEWQAARHVFGHNGLSPELDEPATIQLELLRRRKWDGYVTPRLGTDTFAKYNPEYPVWLGADKRLSAAPLPVPGRTIVSGHIRIGE